jgi:dTDP-4-amino-4,6-dideoxygalactose transaminase
VFNNYIIRTQRRVQRKQFIADHAIQSEIYHPVSLHLQKCFTDLAHRQGEFPQSELAANQLLALPLYPELTNAQPEFLVATIGVFYRR